ncbi:PREDICTED: uncharacterized protein LOC104803775 [Tarenaya hassleriana]|uniref:uncharacterized protein LOC104803775 n=1 Tax=Tarenaya hassleriana TaxID=28532 RepID=UPI00053C0AB3|nr:PREDICTED: uncharacterized protein LOC104803775 [Tarenaya hassleriana]
MLRTRTRSHNKDQAMSQFQFLDPQSDPLRHSSPKTITNPLGLLIGLNNKGLSDCDSVRSPTSPLEFRVCSNVSELFVRSPRSSLQNGHLWNFLGPAKVGLSIVDSLDDDRCLSRDVVFGPAMRVKSCKNQDKSPEFLQEPKSLPEGFPVFPIAQKIKSAASGIVFEIGDDPFEPDPRGLKNRSFSLGSCRSFSTGSNLSLNGRTKSSSESDSLKKTRVLSRSKLGGECNNSGLDTGFLGSPSASDIELSEDYTCIISHGPNPKTTHIYGDRVLECHSLCDDKEKHIPTESEAMFPSDDFLSFCYFCNKKLEEGEDIYMYRGERAFCSTECRTEEMLMEEEEDMDTMNESPRNL